MGRRGEENAMNTRALRRLGKSAVTICTVAAFLAASAPDTVKAGPLLGGLGGALGGSLIGGLIGGRRGARAGALIGGIGGAIAGTARLARRNAYRNRAYYNNRYYYPYSYPRGRAVYAAPQKQLRARGRVARNNVIAGIQSSLTRLGYSPGPVDGLMGGKTVTSIRAYQSANGLLVTGQPSQALLQHMKSRGG
jgi:hypothetical protein